MSNLLTRDPDSSISRNLNSDTSILFFSYTWIHSLSSQNTRRLAMWSSCFNEQSARYVHGNAVKFSVSYQHVYGVEFTIRTGSKPWAQRAKFFYHDFQTFLHVPQVFVVFPSYCMLSLHNITFPQGYVGPCVPYFSLSSNKDADKRHLSILSFLCMRQRRTRYIGKVTPVGFCS